MADFNIRSDSIQVEQIMEQIRTRIQEKRGVDYTEQQIRELAAVKLEKLLDPRGVRSDLLERFRRVKAEHEPADLPNYAFEEETLYESHRAPLRFIRKLLQPLLKLFFNPNRLVQALHIQSQLNTMLVQREAARRGVDELYFEVIHNLVLETTRLGIEVKNLKMRVESLSGRLDFDERRSRALESAVVYRTSGDARADAPGAQAPRSSAPAPASTPASLSPADGNSPGLSPGGGGTAQEGPGQRSRRRRRRRGRRGGGPPPGPGMSPQWTQPREGEAQTAAPPGAETDAPAVSRGDAPAEHDDGADESDSDGDEPDSQ
jgi:hypothetical protein